MSEVLRHIVGDVEIHWYADQYLELIFESGDVEQRDCAGLAGGNGGEDVEVATFLIITSHSRAKQLWGYEAVGFDQALYGSFFATDRIARLHGVYWPSSAPQAEVLHSAFADEADAREQRYQAFPDSRIQGDGEPSFDHKRQEKLFPDRFEHNESPCPPIGLSAVVTSGL